MSSGTPRMRKALLKNFNSNVMVIFNFYGKRSGQPTSVTVSSKPCVTQRGNS